MALRDAAADSVNVAVDFADQVADRAQTVLSAAAARHFSIGAAHFAIRATARNHLHMSRAFAPDQADGHGGTYHTISAWDGTDPAIAPPERPWCDTAHEPLGVVAAYSNDRIRCAFDIHTSSLIVRDRKRQHSYTWYPDIAGLPAWAKASPFRIPVSWLLNQAGLQMVHGAAVSLDGRAVLLAGGGGAGKSTTALACALAGMGYLGDDYCAVDPERASVHMVYRTAKALPGTLRMLPRLDRHVVNADKIAEEKGVIFFDADDLALVRSAALAAILLPRVSGERKTRVSTATRGEAIRALLPSTIGGLMGGTDFTPKALMRLARDVPAFTLELGTDLGAVVGAVASVLEGRA